MLTTYAERLVRVVTWVAAILPLSAHALPGDLSWSYAARSGNAGSSTAIGTDGALYFGGVDHRLYALDPDGSLRWEFETGGLIGSSPAVGADGTVYAGSQDGRLYAVNPDGSRKWAFETEGAIYSSPAIAASGLVFVGSSDGRVYGVSADGSPVWSFSTGDEVGSSPAIGPDGTVYVGSKDGHLYALDPTGGLLWTYAAGAPVGSPGLGIGGRIYVGAFDGTLHAVNLDGSAQWTYDAGAAIASAPAVGPDGAIYGSTLGGRRVFSLSIDGALNWSYTAGGEVYSSAAVAADGTVYVGAMDGLLYALGSDGNLLWSHATDGAVVSSPAVATDGTVYVSSTGGTHYAIEGGAGGLAASTWPMFGRGPLHQRRMIDADSDGDLIYDSWEAFYGLDENDPADALLNPDRDAWTSYAEYIGGTNPGLPNDPITGAVLEILLGDGGPLDAPDGQVTIGDVLVALRMLEDPQLRSQLSPAGQIISDIAFDLDGDERLTPADILLLLEIVHAGD